MSTATTIAIIAPNVVAATAIAAGWKQQSKTLDAQRELANMRFDHERELADLDAVGKLLDEAAVMLHRDAYALDSIRYHLSTNGAGILEDKDGLKAFEKLTAAGEGSDLLIARLEVRRGQEHELVTSLRTASNDALEAWKAVDALKLAPARDDPDDRNVRHRFEMGNEARAKVSEHRATFDAARKAFSAAAVRETNPPPAPANG